MTTRNKFKLLEAQEGHDIRESLIEDYNALGSQEALAQKHGVNQSTVSHWFMRLGLRVKNVLVIDNE